MPSPGARRHPRIKRVPPEKAKALIEAIAHGFKQGCTRPQCEYCPEYATIPVVGLAPHALSFQAKRAA